MKYSILADIFKQLDSTTKRLEMIDILISLFEKTPVDDFKKVIYLTSGKIGADYQELEFGFADKMVIKAIAKAVGKEEKKVSELFKQKGDLGEVAEILMQQTGQQHLGAFFQTADSQSSLELANLWTNLHKIVQIEGKGSTSKKTNILLGIYSKATPLEAKYITRTVLTQLRLGVKDLTIIEALARMTDEPKEARIEIEHAYNITSDIGEVGETLVKNGLAGIKEISIQVGRPIRMMAAQRMASVEEILEKLGGKCALEFKYDGERVQGHLAGEKISLYSRNLNEISRMYPDVKRALRKSLKADEVIVEGEITDCMPSYPPS